VEGREGRGGKWKIGPMEAFLEELDGYFEGATSKGGTKRRVEKCSFASVPWRFGDRWKRRKGAKPYTLERKEGCRESNCNEQQRAT